MYTTTSAGQAVLPRFPNPLDELDQHIIALISQQNGANQTGVNYRVVTGILYLKNETTGLWDYVDTINADGSQAINIPNNGVV